MRNFNRKNDELRKISIQTNVNKFSEGSCKIAFGNQLAAWQKCSAATSCLCQEFMTACLGDILSSFISEISDP